MEPEGSHCGWWSSRYDGARRLPLAIYRSHCYGRRGLAFSEIITRFRRRVSQISEVLLQQEEVYLNGSKVELDAFPFPEKSQRFIGNSIIRNG